jgi:folate-binding protein YgfZ
LNSNGIMVEWQTVYEHAISPGSAGAVIRLPSCGVVRVTGNDCASFLHNMCTNDIRSLRPGEGCEALFTDVKGRIVAHSFVLFAEDAISLLLFNQDPAKLIAHLDRYIIREDVQLCNESYAQQAFAVFGAGATARLNRAAATPIPEFTSPWQHAEVSIGSIPVEVVRCDLPWCGGYIGLTRAADVEVAVRACVAAGATEANEMLWHVIRVESGLPLYGIDFDQSNLPQELNRDAFAIHFRKGCYLGQETVARIDALGHVNKRLAIISIVGEAVPASGVEVYREDDVVGRVTSAAWSPRRQSVIALAMLRRGANDVGTRLLSGGREAEVISSNLRYIPET